MDQIVGLIVPLVLLAILIRLLLLPMKLIWKFLIHAVCGFVCLWLVNTLSLYTGVEIPLNMITASVAGFLGLPGILLLAAVQLLL